MDSVISVLESGLLHIRVSHEGQEHFRKLVVSVGADGVCLCVCERGEKPPRS